MDIEKRWMFGMKLTDCLNQNQVTTLVTWLSSDPLTRQVNNVCLRAIRSVTALRIECKAVSKQEPAVNQFAVISSK